MADKVDRRLLYVLAAAVGIAAVVVAGGLIAERLSDARARAERYETRSRALRKTLLPEADLARERDALDRRVARLRARYYRADEISPYAFGGEVKKRLRSAGMTVARYQIMESKGKSFLEFAVSGRARSFLQFLRDVSLQGKYWTIPSMTVDARAGGDVVEVVFKIGYEVIDETGH